MAGLSHLKSLQALELAARMGSLKAVADHLAITPAAVGQRIKALEAYLGIDLLVRGRSGLKPTPELAQALPHLEKAFVELETACDALDLQRVNEIHIAANSDWIDLWLKPRLPAFRAAHPNILFCLNGQGDVPMRLGAADLEITFAPLDDSEPRKLLFHDYLAPIGTPENVARLDQTNSAASLDGLPLLHLDFYKEDPGALDWPTWALAFGHRQTARNRGLRYRQISVGLDAVNSNAGFMICGLAMLLDKIRSGELRLVFPIDHGGWTRHAFQVRLRQKQAPRAHLRRFCDWMMAECATMRAELEALVGPCPYSRSEGEVSGQP